MFRTPRYHEAMPPLPLAPSSGSAFRYRNFRLYWGAQLISLMGTFMQSVALGYLVYALTDSKWLLGIISALQMGPSLLLSLPAGVVADRVNRRSLILGTQISALLLAFTLATLTALNQLQVWEILVISTLSGIAIALESPARQAFISQLVEPADLPNAIGWNSLVVNGSRVIGPAAGGIIIRFLGVAPIFYFNSLSFLAMIVALLFMSLPAFIPRRRHPLEDLREGLLYIRRAPAIMAILALVALMATFIMNFSVLMPVIAHDLLHTGAVGLGWLWTAFGLGAVAGSATVVTWSRAATGGRLLLSASLIAAVSTFALAVAPNLVGAMLLLVAVGWSTGAFFAGANAAIQHRVTDAVRGRVLSVYSMIFAGSTPLGGLFVAWLASAGGVARALAGAGGVTLAGVLLLVVPVRRALSSPPSAADTSIERAAG